MPEYQKDTALLRRRKENSGGASAFGVKTPRAESSRLSLKRDPKGIRDKCRQPLCETMRQAGVDADGRDGERLPSTLVKAPLSATVAFRYLILYTRTDVGGLQAVALYSGSKTMPLGESDSDSWQRYALKPDSRQRIALTPSFSGITVLRKQRISAGRRGNVMPIIRQKYPLGNSCCCCWWCCRQPSSTYPLLSVSFSAHHWRSFTFSRLLFSSMNALKSFVASGSLVHCS